MTPENELRLIKALEKIGSELSDLCFYIFFGLIFAAMIAGALAAS